MAADGKNSVLNRLLLLESDPAHLNILTTIFRDAGFDVIGCSSSREGLEHLDPDKVGVALIEIHFSNMAESILFEKINKVSSELPVIINTGHATKESAIAAINGGVFAYLEKDQEPNRLIDAAPHNGPG